MEENNFGEVQIKIQSLSCPTCGSRLKYKPGEESVTCPFCENVCYITKSRNVSHSEHSDGGAGGYTRIEGMQTPSSVLAYVEQFFDNYDWDAFAHDDDLSVFKIDGLVEKIKTVSADDYKTWVSAFLSVVVPLNKKIESRKTIYAAAIEEYKRNNADAYSMYECYKRVTNGVIYNYDAKIEIARKYLDYAVKYGIPEDYKKELEGMINPDAVNAIKGTIFNSIHDIPGIVEYNKKQEEALKRELSEKGIDADSAYERAVKHFEEKEYKEALELFYSLNGFKESNKYIERINKYSSVGKNALITDNALFFVKARGVSSGASVPSYSLYRYKDKVLEQKETANDLASIVCNYGGTIIYYTNTETDNLRALELSTGKVTKIVGSYVRRLYYLKLDLGMAYLVYKDSAGKKSVVRLNLKTLKPKKVFGFDDKDVAFFDNQIIYRKVEDGLTCTYGYDVLTGDSFKIVSKNVMVVGFNNNRYYITEVDPDKNNKNLYYVDRKEKSRPVLIESNIVDPVKIIDDKIYYFSKSNTGYHYLINNDLDGNNRVELSSRVKKLLFKQGDWLYCIRGYGYNTALCRMKTDGTCYQSIASQIDKFVKIENGFIYYIDDEDDFCSVRMDGGKDDLIASNVDKVLEINDRSVIFSAKDGGGQSIFEIEFGKKGHRKLAYLIDGCCKYDEKYIYYVTARQKNNEVFNSLKRINIETYKEEKLFTCSAPKKGCYIATCVYGSYDCPEVWALRRYRDFYLDNHWWGRAFIRMYYAVSPTIVKIFGKNNFFLKLSRYLLNKKIKKLKENGYQDTRYSDKY